MTIIPMETQKRLNKLEELKKKTNYLMNLKQIRKSQSNFDASSSAAKDTYMTDALEKVRQSKVTIDSDYSRFVGTSLYTESQREYDDLEKDLDELQKEVESELEKTPKTKFAKQLEPKKETKKQVLSPKQMNEEITWNKICEQLGHKRLHEKRSTSFFGQLRESLQTKQHRTLLNLKRSTLDEYQVSHGVSCT